MVLKKEKPLRYAMENIKHLKEKPFKRLTGVEPKTFRFMVKVLKIEASKKPNNRS